MNTRETLLVVKPSFRHFVFEVLEGELVAIGD